MGNDSDFIVIGKISGVHGIKGAVKAISYAESDNIFTPGSKWRVRCPSGETENLTIVSVTPLAKSIRILFEEVQDRTQAKQFIGAELFVKRSMLPDLEDGTYYWFQIIGIPVFTVGGNFLGNVTSVLPTGSNDVYIVKNKAAQRDEEILIPALTSYVVEIDIRTPKMVVDLPQEPL